VTLDSSSQVEITVVEQGQTVRTEKVSESLRGRHFIYLGKSSIPYVWQGESRVEYLTDGGVHRVNNEVYGIELDKVSCEDITDPGQIKGVLVAADQFACLSQFRGLLTICTSGITESTVEYVVPLSKLMVADFGLEPGFTDNCLKRIAGCTEMRMLNLIKTPVTDKGLIHLKAMSKLETLWLQGTRVTGEGLRHLSPLTGLQTLGLGDTGVSGSDISVLQALPVLELLSLVNTPVTDAAVGHLVRIQSLENLDIRGTRISAEGADRLKKALPGCVVTGD